MPLSPPRPPPRPKQGSRPDLPSAQVDTTVGAGRGYTASQDHVRPELARKRTLPGIAVPGPPPLPIEHQPTERAPSPWGKTVMRPAPPSTTAQAQRSEPPPRSASPAPPDAAKTPPRAAIEPSFPPPVIERRDAPPLSAPPDRGAWHKLAYKVATAVAGALVLVLAAGGTWAVTAINAKTEAIKAAQAAQAKADAREEQWRKWFAVAVWILDCRHQQQLEVNESLLPAPDKMGSARKQTPWQPKCPKELPPPP